MSRATPQTQVLILSWARIYSAVLEADEREMEYTKRAHVNLFDDEFKQDAEFRVEHLLRKALGMEQRELKALYERCLNFRDCLYERKANVLGMR